MSLQLSALAPLIALVALVPRASAEAVATATCKAALNFDWAFNSLDQSPCLVGAYAQSACTDGNYVVGPLDPGYIYPGPTTADAANPCRCSVPVWSLISACGACQNASANPWNEWSKGCGSTTEYYPEAIPAGTKIPAWAYLKVPANNVWSPTLAQAALNAPESTPVASATSSTTTQSTVTSISQPPTSSTVLASATFSSSTASSSSVVSSASSSVRSTSSNGSSALSGSGSSSVIVRTTTASGPDPSNSGSSSSGGGGSNAGPIAGGVVGGIVALALIGGLLFWLRRRRQHEPVPTNPPESPYNPPMVQQSAAPMVGGGYVTPYTPNPEQRPLYNPNDPSTYPQAMGSDAPSGQGQFYHSAMNPFQTPLPTPSGVPTGYAPPPPLTPNRGYTGTPEV